MIKEIPILFSTEMVREIIAGHKTQTRRVMKPQIKDCNHSAFTEATWKDQPTKWSEMALSHGRAYCELCGNGVEGAKDLGGIKCPYGKPGDLLWVRESWRNFIIGGGVGYKADVLSNSTLKWKPSIHMKKEHARIWLKVNNVKAERLHDITERDVCAEGAGANVRQFNLYGSDAEGRRKIYRYHFQFLWEKINGKESWRSNPWVWVIDFKVLSTIGKPDGVV